MKPLMLSAALLFISACVIVEPECEPAETRCMGDVLEICGEGWMPLNDCAADGLVCPELEANHNEPTDMVRMTLEALD